MKHKKMRKSSVIILSTLGVMALIVVILVGLGRVAVSRMTSGEASNRGTIDFSNRVTMDFDVEGFRGVTFIGSWEVDIEQGDDWQVELTYPKDIEEELNVKIRGDQLILDPGRRSGNNWGWWGGGQNKRLKARIVMPELEELNIVGTSNLDFSGFEGKQLDITLSGAGNIEGDDGHYVYLSLTMSGAGNVDLRDMDFVDARVVLSGAGNIELGMDGGELSGNISGFGNIEYYGSVSDESVHVSGIGKVRRRD